MSDLLKEDAKQDNSTYIDLQLLRIISPVNIAGSSGAYNYSKNKNNRRGTQTNYTRLFLVRSHSKEEGDKLAYIMETRTENKSLWTHNVELRDNGMLTIGAIFRMLAPRPIENLMVGDIPLLVTKFPVRMMKPIYMYRSIDVDPQIGGNNSFAFTLNNACIEVDGLSPIMTSCSGLLCDRQRVDDWNGSERGCGCYSMHHRRSNLAFQHDLKITTQDGNRFLKMNGFSSNKFSKLYLSNTLSPSVVLQHLQFTDEFFSLEDCIQDVLNYIHDNGGFTIIGWYKRGEINDRSLVTDGTNQNNNYNNNDENVRVGSGTVSYHVTQILPTVCGLLNCDVLRSKKFDASRFH
jgi:hypothetical protein